MSKPHEVGKNFRQYPGAKSEAHGDRGRRSKMFNLERGRRAVRISTSPVHYLEEPDKGGQDWKEIDLTFQEKDGVYYFDKAPYMLRCQSDKLAYEIISRTGDRGRIRVELKALDDVVPNFNQMVVTVKNKYIEWKFGVLAFRLVVSPERVDMFKLLPNPSVQKKYTWSVVADIKSGLQYDASSTGTDADGRPLEIKNEITSDLVVNDMRILTHVEEFTGKKLTIPDKATRIKGTRPTSAYPMEIS